MKKTIGLVTVFIIAAALLFTACSKEPEQQDPPMVGTSAGENLELGLWVDDDTFRISAKGLIKEKHQKKSPSIRQEMACGAAKLVAIHKIMNAFAGSETKNISSKKTGTETFEGTIRNGTVVEETFDPSANECLVVYEVKEDNLRKSVRKK